MVDIKDIEVYSIEIELVTNCVLEEIVQTDIQYLVLLKNGKYVGIYEKSCKKIMSDSLIIESKNSKDVFALARNYFSDYKNRSKFLAILNNNEELLTFAVWNQGIERSTHYIEETMVQIMQLLEAGYNIYFEDWNEYTVTYLDFLKETAKYKTNIFLTGDNWELYSNFDLFQFSLENSKKEIVVNKKGINFITEENIVYPLKRIKEQYWNKSLYVYLDTLAVVYPYITRLLCKYEYMPAGFCELHDEKESESFLGTEVIELEEVVKRPDVMVLVIQQVDIDKLKKYVPGEKLIIFDELFEIDGSITATNRFQTWGRNDVWAKMKCTLASINIQAPYRNYKDKNDMPGILLWEVMKDHSPAKYLEYMRQVNHNTKLYSLDAMYETPYWFSSAIQLIRNLQEAIDKQKKFIIYGIKSHYTNMWIHILRMFGFSFEIMDDEEQENWYGYHIECIHELSFCNIENIVVVINQPYGELPRSTELLKTYGISKELHNCISVYEQTDRTDLGDYEIDICAGPLSELHNKNRVAGYCFLGKDQAEDYKILTLGGSTSDSALYQYKSWPEELYCILEEKGVHVTIYSGGISSAVSIQELTKLVRDARELQPNMIISFSGFNDILSQVLPNGYVNGVCGTNYVYQKDKFENWLENERMMSIIAERVNAVFFCFAQPMFYLMENMDRYGRILTKEMRHREHWDWKKKVRNVKGYPWFIDLMDILNDRQDVFFDSCHVTTEGNRIIAENIYSYIKDYI